MDSDVPSRGWYYKCFLIGALFAISWLALFVTIGAIWSLNRPDTETLKIFEHIYNGWIFAKLMNLLALLGGVSVGINALFGLSKNIKSNLMIAGFIVTHFSIVVANFWIGDFEFKEDPRPDTVIDKIIDLRESLQKKK